MPGPHAPPAATDTKAPDVDPPSTVAGYKTDPLRRGYQVLGNYEVYWRRLVGHDAWGLYAVWRSFGSAGKPVCPPASNFLLEILGGKAYRSPRLSASLPQHDRATGAAPGAGAQLHSVCPVNRPPGRRKRGRSVTRRAPAPQRPPHRGRKQVSLHLTGAPIQSLDELHLRLNAPAGPNRIAKSELGGRASESLDRLLPRAHKFADLDEILRGLDNSGPQVGAALVGAAEDRRHG